ncbi:Protein MLP1 [Yarrowia sp. C11]|nr:Protein MLP1 [Yarrowia sp. C11]KAG5364181.1 Protein MLP1 [Yarrowia sp. E02]
MDENMIDATMSTSHSPSEEREFVAKFFQLDEATVQQLPDNLTGKLASEAKRFEVANGQKRMAEVQYEQATHSYNTKMKTFKSQLDQAKGTEQELTLEIATLKAEAKSFEDAKQSMDSASGRSAAVVESLRNDISLLESEKRRLLESLETRGSDFVSLRADLEALQGKNGEHRRVIVELEAQVQKEHAAVLQARFKEEQLKQETQQLKKSNAWLDEELKAKQEEHSSFRRDKAQLVARLQAEVEQTAAERDGLRASLDTARSSNNTVSAKVEELLSRNKQLQDAAAVAEENFRREMSAQKRLAELYEKSASDAKARVNELENGGNAKLRAAVEEERAKSASLETKLEAVEKQLQELHGSAGGPLSITNGTPAPSTPLRGGLVPGGNGTPFSPSAKIVSELNRGGISLVQLYADYQDVCRRLEKERSRNDELQGDFDRLLEEMEQHTPAILAERDECKRLEGELVQLSMQLQEVAESREKLAAGTEKAEVAARDGQREIKLLQQQLSDASRQIQYMLVQQKMREGNSGPLTVAERETLNGMLSGEVDDSDTGRIISERLVVYADVIGMQKQNERLLKISRELGQKLEAKEAETRDKMANVESAAIQEAHDALESVVADMERLQGRFEAVSRERDMFRRISGDKESGGVGSNTNAIMPSSSASDASIEVEWNAFKTETNATIKSLNTQISSLSDERHTLQINLSKAESQCVLLGERLQNLKNNSEITRQEREQLRQRVEQLQEAATRQEIRTQAATEDVVAARSTCDQLRGEVSNLQAEKRVWKSIEQRITKDNSELMDEKTRLNGVIAQMQVTESERSTQEGESRKRLVSQLEALEQSKSSTEKQLDEARAELRKVSDRRDIEQVQHQERVDALNKETGAAREHLAVAKAEVASLKERNASLESQVTSLTQQVAVLQQQSEGDEATQLGRLKNELVSAQNELGTVKSELASANAQVEQFKGLAQAAEEGLDNMVASHDEYKKSMEEQLETQTKSVAGLEEQNKVLSEELKLAQNEIDVLQRQEGEQISAVVGEKKELLSQIESLKAETSTLSSETAELKSQLQETTVNCATYQSNYETELVKHAEAANSLTALRSQFNEVKTQIAVSAAEAKSAKDQLESASESWDTQKNALEGEVAKLKSRVDDVVSQNNLLLDSLETRKAGGDVSGDSTNTDVVTYLRQEKEIIETQHELAIQENKRLQARLDHVSVSLDEARSDLERLKASVDDGAKSESARQELADKMEQLSVFRESNKTLRMECEASNKEVARLQATISGLEAKLEPFENQLSDREAEIEAQKGEISLLKEDNERWRARTQQILQRHERVDPAELESAKKELEAKDKELEEVKNELEASKGRLERLKEEASRKLKHAQQTRTAAQQELVTAQAALAEAKKAGSAGSEAHTAEVAALKQQVEKLTGELKKATAKAAETQSQLNAATAKVAESQSKLEAATAQVNESQSKLAAASAELEKVKQEASNTASEFASFKATAAAAAAASTQPVAVEQSAVQVPVQAPVQNEELTNELTSARAEIESLKKEVDAARAAAASVAAEAATVKETAPVADASTGTTAEAAPAVSTETAQGPSQAELEALSQKIAALEKELAQKEEEIKNAPIPDAVKAQIASLEAQVTQLETEKKAVETELAQVREELKQVQETAAKTVVEGAPQSPPSDESYRLKVKEEVLAATKKEHEEEIERLRQQWQAPLDEWKTRIRKQANDKVKEKIDTLNTEWKGKMDALTTECEAKIKQKEAEINESNPEFQERIKTEIERARESERKMAEMRQKLLTSKVAKLEEDLKNYNEGGMAAVPTGPAATIGGPVGLAGRPQSRIPGPTIRGGRGGRGGLVQPQRPSIVRPGSIPMPVAGVNPFVPGAVPGSTTAPAAESAFNNTGVPPGTPTGPGGGSAKRPLSGEQPDAQKKRRDD